MCNVGCISFGDAHLTTAIVCDKLILDFGASDINGGFRERMMDRGCLAYLGIDLEPGRSVDQICNVYDLVKTFGSESFDIVISTEMLEHVEDWETAVRNMKIVCKRGGYLLLTTRSKGFKYHPYPVDWWRFEIDDMKRLFSDFEVIEITEDPTEDQPGVFVFARKPVEYQFDVNCYSISPYRIEGQS